MEDVKYFVEQFLEKVLSNEVTAFLFVVGASIGAFLGIAGGYYFAFQAAVWFGAY